VALCGQNVRERSIKNALAIYLSLFHYQLLIGISVQNAEIEMPLQK
jgi:hypothetical protein